MGAYFRCSGYLEGTIVFFSKRFQIGSVFNLENEGKKWNKSQQSSSQEKKS